MAELDQEKLVRCAVLIFGGLNFCEACGREAYAGDNAHDDAAYERISKILLAEGWTASGNGMCVFCPDCSARNR